MFTTNLFKLQHTALAEELWASTTIDQKAVMTKQGECGCNTQKTYSNVCCLRRKPGVLHLLVVILSCGEWWFAGASGDYWKYRFLSILTCQTYCTKFYLLQLILVSRCNCIYRFTLQFITITNHSYEAATKLILQLGLPHEELHQRVISQEWLRTTGVGYPGLFSTHLTAQQAQL